MGPRFRGDDGIGTWRHSRESGNPFFYKAKIKMGPRFRGDDGGRLEAEPAEEFFHIRPVEEAPAGGGEADEVVVGGEGEVRAAAFGLR